jgi:TatD DNase family protein
MRCSVLEVNTASLLYDCHAHLDDPRCKGFLDSLANIEQRGNRLITVISNSVDANSSRRNQEFAKRFSSVKALVGIHPEIFARRHSISEGELNTQIEEVEGMAASSSGIGEIGLDSAYGNGALQERIFVRQLEIAESRKAAVSIHSRNSVSKILSIIKSYKLSKVLFHWFAGSDKELKDLIDERYFASFGLSILYSKRLVHLLHICDPQLILAETDSPLVMESILGKSPLSPFLVASTIFAIASVRHLSFEEMLAINERNAAEFMRRKAD